MFVLDCYQVDDEEPTVGKNFRSFSHDRNLLHDFVQSLTVEQIFLHLIIWVI